MNSNIPFTESPFFNREIENQNFSATEKQILKNFSEDGYVILSPNIKESTIDEIINELDPFFNKLDGFNKRIVNAWKYNQNVRSIATNKEIQDTLRLLYQREPIPFQTLNFPVGTEQKTHSDMIHFNSIPQRFMCGVWIAFEDIHEDNGPLHYYPGSHKLPFYDMIDIGVKGSKNTDFKKEMMSYAKDYETFVEKIVKELDLKKETLNIKKGQVLIWSANLLHGGEMINTKGLTRHSQVTHYFFENCIYYTPYFSDIAINKLFIREIPNINTGKKVQNTYFNEKVNLHFKNKVKSDIVEMLSKISHLFPQKFTEKVKKSIGI